jgi:poly(3-hydroxybutyrate) depolymerase
MLKSLLCILLLFICNVALAEKSSVENFEGRSLILHVPAKLPAFGRRAFVVVLHGGLGKHSELNRLNRNRL